MPGKVNGQMHGKCKVNGKVDGKGEQMANTKVKDEDKTDDAGRGRCKSKRCIFDISLSLAVVGSHSLSTTFPSASNVAMMG